MKWGEGGREADRKVCPDDPVCRRFVLVWNAEDSPVVLHGINLDVKAGEVLAVVGSSGAGKSTLVHLIPRFFDVSGGRV